MFLSKGTPSVPEMDLVFAMSANSGDADSTFNLMKKTVKEIVNVYGFIHGKIHYGVIVYGATPTTFVQLGDSTYKNVNDLRKYIEALPKRTSDPRIDKALEEALQVFQGPKARPGAKQVLVVLTDKKSMVSREAIEASARPLEEKNIRVIPVAVGREADPEELSSTTPYREDVIKAKGNEEPERLARKIINKALTGKI